MPKALSKLAQLTNWVRENADRKGIFRKSALYAFARSNDLERSALMFVWRCRQNGTMLDVDDDRIKVPVSKGKNLEQFYKVLLKIVDTPILECGPELQEKKARGKQPEPENGRKDRSRIETQRKELPKQEPAQKEDSERQVVEKQPTSEVSKKSVSDVANVVVGLLNGELKRIDDKVTSLSNLVESRFNDLLNNASLPRLQELEQRTKQLEKQLKEFREKAEAFDLIKRDAWEVVQALDIVQVERDDLKKVIKKFL